MPTPRVAKPPTDSKPEAASLPEFHLSQVIAVAETRSHRIANVFIEHGWKLLNISAVNWPLPNKDRGLPSSYMRGTQYVMGSTVKSQPMTVQAAGELLKQRREAVQE